MVSSVLNEGVRGLQLSQREMQRSANEIARANVRDDTEAQADSDAQTALQPVDQIQEPTQRGIEESLIELRRQEQLFTASAEVISAADQALGSLIDVRS